MSGERVQARVPVSDVREGEGRLVEVGGRSVAVFVVGGDYYAIDNTCPHRGGPLAEGEVDGRVVTCPWHAWRWDVTTGANVNNPAVRVARYPVRVEGEEIVVDLG
jgi:3-phenylpropionate/trans-cinnamate dioxygenase ferredoxin component